MRARVEGPVLVCRAIAGTYVVILAWDFLEGQEARHAGLMGFALERTEHGSNGVVERYWLRGMKRFRKKDEGLAPGSLVPTVDHPIQAFQWGDYTAKAGTTYSYRVLPVYGKPKLLDPDDAAATTVKITTEAETQDTPAGDGPRHDIYFNRGVIGSQAYARKFKNKEPDPNNPDSEEMKWLSRGLYEGLQGFIARGARDGFGLRAALYEFHYQPIANAFARAIEAGGDVKIVYDAESPYKVGNEETINKAGLDTNNAVIPRTVSEGLRHNKFIVLLKGNDPIAVWTGSTNISPGGIFGHSNVGHIVWDADVAKAYLKYWDRLADNLTPTKLRAPNRKASPVPKAAPPKGSITPLFSPRDDKDSLETLQWYADRMAEAKEIVCFTVAFNLDAVFQEVIAVDNNVLRYVVKDDDLGDSEIIGRDRDVLFAAGAFFGNGALENFIKERGNPLNRNDYIHTKFMLVDPLSDDPLIVTGSANFSRPSQRINDENMLIIRGDTRVADIYFGEYMRVFDHHYARYIVRKLQNLDRGDPDAGYLKEDTQDWLPAHLNADSYKAKRRKYFVG